MLQNKHLTSLHPRSALLMPSATNKQANEQYSGVLAVGVFFSSARQGLFVFYFSLLCCLCFVLQVYSFLQQRTTPIADRKAGATTVGSASFSHLFPAFYMHHAVFEVVHHPKEAILLWRFGVRHTCTYMRSQ